MFLGSYDFDGDPAVLVAAYERLMGRYPPDLIDLHLCIVGDAGITVFDACPSRDVFDTFSRSAELSAAMATAGLPVPRVTARGSVHRAEIREAIR